ncbi:MAG TPA: alcohol dehydrogenase catalytic domain-containing protein [Streptosporangiaceae bacterium]|nr:alcohol dehydrogenase catalytic domain-containing protein [Streptosporangiaceae bacterium]
MSDALVVLAPQQVVLAARDEPVATPGETLIRPDLVGLCGTDLEIIGGQVDPAFVRYPIGLGHEWTGIVSGDSPLSGTRVVAEGIVACGHCARCVRGETNLCETYDEFGFTRDGAATGLVAVPTALVHPIAADVAAQDAVLIEPASVVYRGLVRAAVTPGSRVLVIGDGTVALLAVYLLRLWSPAVVVLLGRRDAQRAIAAEAGASRFETSPDAAGAGYDLVVEAAGAVQAAAVALTAARRGGTVLLLGLPPHGETVALAVDDVVNNDIAILGSFSYTASAWRDVVGLLNAGLIRPGFLVTHRFALTDWAKALDCLRGDDGPRGKVVLEIGTRG